MKYAVFVCTLLMILVGQASAQTRIIDKVKAKDEQGESYVQPETTLGRTNAVPLNTVQEAFSKAPSTANARRYVFNPMERIDILSRLAMGTTIILPEGEEIPDGGAILFDPTTFKFSVRNDGQGRKRVLVVLPLFAKCDTNFTVMGKSGNVYSFYLKSETYSAKQVPDFVVYVSDSSVKERVRAADMANEIVRDAETLAAKEKEALEAVRMEGEFLPARQLDHDYLSSLPYENPAKINTAYVLK